MLRILVITLSLTLLVNCESARADDPPASEASPATEPQLIAEQPDEFAQPTDVEATLVDEFQVLSPSRRRLAEVDGIGNSELRVFRDGRPLKEGEHESLAKLLYRLPSIPANDVAGWAESATDWSEIEQDPWRHRAKVFYVQGYVQRVTVVPVVEELAEELLFDKFYRCELELVGSDRLAIIYCRNIPKAWPLDKPLHEFAAAYGWFLKAGAVRGDRHDVVLAASRIKWHPEEATERMNLNRGHLLLAKHGMDIGLWDYISNGQGIGEWFNVKGRRVVRVESRNMPREEFTELLAGERDAFYQLLNAASDVPEKVLKKAASNELAEREQETYSIVPLFNDPKSQYARVVALDGVARRATKVVVGKSSDFPGQASDVKLRYGLDHYYVIDFFTSDSQNEPLVFITNELPAQMPEGEEIHADVRITGFYFKKYAYPAMVPNEETAQMELVKREAPLLVGGIVEYVPPETEASNPLAGLIAGVLFVVALGGIWLGVYFFGAGDRKFGRDTVSRAFMPDAGKSLDDLEGTSVDRIGPPAE